MKAVGRGARFLEQSCASYVACLGRYIGDGAQPLHDSVNSDGWRGPNPYGYTTDPSILWRFEGSFVDAIGFSAADIVPHVAAPAHLTGDLFDAVLTYLDARGARMEVVYRLDKRGAFADPQDKEARAIDLDRTTTDATMLRDMIYRAWLESAAIPPQSAANPLDPADPAYNPETGTLPVPRDPGR